MQQVENVNTSGYKVKTRLPNGSVRASSRRINVVSLLFPGLLQGFSQGVRHNYYTGGNSIRIFFRIRYESGLRLGQILAGPHCR